MAGLLVRGAMRAMLVVVGVLLVTVPAEPAEAGGFERKQRQYERVRDAFDAHLDDMKKAFARERAAWPPRDIFLRVFKLDSVIELWAAKDGGKANGPRVLVQRFPICAKSGELGPKSRAGDGQVPEGFYTINRFNPRSSYHLSLGLDYPNAVDLVRADGAAPGGDIFIHGNCVTIGCMPIQDGPVESLYLVAVLAKDGGQKSIPVHVFPFHFGAAEAAPYMRGASPELAAFWSVLEQGYRAFEATQVPPKVRATAKGYVFPASR